MEPTWNGDFGLFLVGSNATCQCRFCGGLVGSIFFKILSAPCSPRMCQMRPRPQRLTILDHHATRSIFTCHFMLPTSSQTSLRKPNAGHHGRGGSHADSSDSLEPHGHHAICPLVLRSRLDRPRPRPSTPLNPARTPLTKPFSTEPPRPLQPAERPLGPARSRPFRCDNRTGRPRAPLIADASSRPSPFACARRLPLGR